LFSAESRDENEVVDELPEIATHTEPVLRAEADFLIHAGLAEFGMPGRSEQLWVKKLGGDHFQICCLPFFTYGIAPRDVVFATPGESEQFMFRHPVE